MFYVFLLVDLVEQHGREGYHFFQFVSISHWCSSSFRVSIGLVAAVLAWRRLGSRLNRDSALMSRLCFVS